MKPQKIADKTDFTACLLISVFPVLRTIFVRVIAYFMVSFLNPQKDSSLAVRN